MKILRQARKVGWKPLLQRKILPYGTPIQVTVDDIPLKVRARTPDLYVAVETLAGEYDFVSNYLGAEFDGLIVDAGGYIGTAAIAFARAFPQATVVTLEPEARNFEMLRENTRPYRNILPRQAALSSRGGDSVDLYDDGLREWGYSVIRGRGAGTGARLIGSVPTMSLADIESETGQKIGFLKMDIEGAEKEILEAGGDVLNDIPLVFVELHDRIVEGCTEAFHRFAGTRRQLNFGGEKYLAAKS